MWWLSAPYFQNRARALLKGILACRTQSVLALFGLKCMLQRHTFNKSLFSSRYLFECEHTVCSNPFLCTRGRRNPTAFSKDQEDEKRRFAPTLRAGGPALPSEHWRIPSTPLGPLHYFNSHHRRTLEVVLQKGHASFRITSSPPTHHQRSFPLDTKSGVPWQVRFHNPPKTETPNPKP